MQEKIKELLKQAMLEKNEAAKLTYRSLLSSIMVFLTSSGKKPQDTVTDEEVLAVIRKEIKKREDSIKQFTDAGRPELAENEIEEKNILMQFLPTQLSEAEVEERVKNILAAMGTLDPKNMGKYVGMCVKELKDVASGDLVKKAVEKFVA